MTKIFQHGGCAIVYEEIGAGTPVLLAHGFGLDRNAMRCLADALANEYRCVLFDWRGHGETESPTDDAAYSYPIMRDDLLSLMDHLQIERAHFVGHSMGGQIMLMAAIKAPQRVVSVTTIGAGPCRKVTDPKEEKAWQRSAAFFEQATQEQIVQALLSSSNMPENSAARSDAAALFGRARGADLARMIRGAFLNVESNDVACSELSLPLLVLVGEADTTWLGASEKLHSLVPRSRFEVIRGAGHLAHLEKPEEVRAIVLNFLNESNASA